MINQCQFCGKEYQIRNKESKFCSASCRNRSRKKLLKVNCEHCGKEMEVVRKGSYTQRFCSQHCVGVWNTARPEFKEKMKTKEFGQSVSMGARIARKKDPEKYKKIFQASSERMKKSNPMDNPEIIEKAKATKRIKGTLHIFLGQRGGNGHYTEPQILLATALGWQLEYAISLGKLKSGYPTNYKVDIANPELKIAIEVDGKGHQTKKNILKDTKKMDALNVLGWKVLRFTNQEIMTDLSKVLFQIQNVLKDM